MKVYIIISYEEGWYSNERDIQAVYETKELAEKYQKEFEDKEKIRLGNNYGKNGIWKFEILELEVVKE